MENEENVEKKKGFKSWYSEHPKTVFTIRAILWATFSAILPFLFIVWRYGIFKPSCKIKLSGWGIIGVIILILFVIKLVSYLIKGMKFSLAKQCILGFLRIVLPLVLLLLFVIEVKNNIQLIYQALICVIACEIVGIPLNPFPAWLEQKRIEEGKEQANDLFDMFLDKFFKRKKDDK